MEDGHQLRDACWACHSCCCRHAQRVQEELAILRAQEEFAKRFVSIRSVQTLTTTVAGGRASTVWSLAAQEETRQDEVKAVVRAKWLNLHSEVLWVWLVPDNH